MRNTMSFAFLGLLGTATGCFHTKTSTGAPMGAQEYEDRQWFTLAGLVPLSSPAGGECGPQGMAMSDSRLSGMDVLILIGLSVAGTVAGTSLCSKDAAGNVNVGCAVGVGNLVPLLIGSRTVTYHCAEAGPGVARGVVPYAAPIAPAAIAAPSGPPGN